LAHVDEATLFVLFAASHDAAYATATEFVADSGYLLAPVDATPGPPPHHAAVVTLLAALRRTHLPASPAPGSTSDNAPIRTCGTLVNPQGAGLRALPRRILGRVLKP
jgi:hypothetical protein